MAEFIVPERRIKIAAKHLENAYAAARACEKTGLRYAPACALLEKESGGRNVYGHDVGGALSGFPGVVTRGNFEVFHWLVFDQGQQSNGVGPCQITFKGHFPVMEERGLSPWIPEDNMIYGFRVLNEYYETYGDWVEAGRRYNGALAYGQDLAEKIEKWNDRFQVGSER
jgi:hypothetical protein